MCVRVHVSANECVRMCIALVQHSLIRSTNIRPNHRPTACDDCRQWRVGDIYTDTQTYTHAHIDIYTDRHTDTYTHIDIHIDIQTRAHRHIHTHWEAHKYIHTHIDIDTKTYTHIDIHTKTYTHTYT